MADAEFLKTTVDLATNTSLGEAVLRANGSVVTFPGFLKVADSSQRDTELPAIDATMKAGPGEAIAIASADATKHETKPPARYTEAALIKQLEEEGIGRPSTYAPTISTIQARGYVTKKGNALVPDLCRHRGDAAAAAALRRVRRPEVHGAHGRRPRRHRRGPRGLDQFPQGVLSRRGPLWHGLQPSIEEQIGRHRVPRHLHRQRGGRPAHRRAPWQVPAFRPEGRRRHGQHRKRSRRCRLRRVDPEKAEELIEQKSKGNEGLGQDPETGLTVYALVGPYGPYVQLGDGEVVTTATAVKPPRARPRSSRSSSPSAPACSREPRSSRSR
jgi:DNA topoisomerase-1